MLRAYGSDGNFDETHPRPLWITYDTVAKIDDEDADADAERIESDSDLFMAYGENGLSTHNIGLSSGTVSVRGNDVPDGHEVWVAGRPIPVDERGSFVT